MRNDLVAELRTSADAGWDENFQECGLVCRSKAWMNHLRRGLMTNSNLGIITRVNHHRTSSTDGRDSNMTLCFYIFVVIPQITISYASCSIKSF